MTRYQRSAPAAPGANPIETLRFDPPTVQGDGVGLQRLEKHLARLARTAHWLGYPCPLDSVRAAIVAACEDAHPTGALRVRCELQPDGQVRVDLQPLVPSEPERAAGRTVVALERVRSDDPWRRHKTTHRPLYDAATRRARALGLLDVLFLNERDEVVEGAISTLFIAPAAGATRSSGAALITPPVDSGALPGIFRAELLERGRAQVARVHVSELQAASAVFLGSSLRGLRRIIVLDDLLAVVP